jgi:hypothetical protein
MFHMSYCVPVHGYEEARRGDRQVVASMPCGTAMIVDAIESALAGVARVCEVAGPGGGGPLWDVEAGRGRSLAASVVCPSPGRERRRNRGAGVKTQIL